MRVREFLSPIFAREMSKPPKNIAIILAAGHGSRSGFSKPKQLMKLAGRPIIEHTVQAFQNNTNIDEIIVVTNSACLEAVENIALTGEYKKLTSIINGGPQRFDSSISAIRATKHHCAQFKVNLIFHDAVRPLVSQRIIDDVINALSNYNAVDVVVRTTDTIVVADRITNTIQEIPSRDNLRNGQTPQAFAHSTIEQAYEVACKDAEFETTDDCGVVLRYMPNEKIYLVDGDANNIKLTYKEDLHILDKLCQLKSNLIQPDAKNNLKFSALKGKVIAVFGGSSGIGKEIANIARAHQARVVSVGYRDGIDVGDINSIKTFLMKVNNKYEKIDFIINSAAILVKRPLIDMGPDDISRAIQVNYLGAVNVAVAAFPYLRATRGHLLNFASSSYTYERSFYSLYSSSKAAVVNLTQALADEWHGQEIQVNCINPDRTKTPMRTKAFGVEPESTLLDPKTVATRSLQVLLSNYTGQIFDVRNLK